MYLSTEHPAEAGGYEYFSEVGAGLGLGVSARLFTSLSGGSGLLLMTTTGEELEMSIGVGETTLDRYSEDPIIGE